MEGNTILNPNPLVKFLNKPQKEFTKADIIRYVTKNDIEMILLQQDYDKLQFNMKILIEIGCFWAGISSEQSIFTPFCCKKL